MGIIVGIGLTLSVALAACGGGGGSGSGSGVTTTTSGQAAAPKTSVPGSSTTVTFAPETPTPGDIPDTVAYIPYSNAAGGYTFSHPEGWAQTGQGTSVSFTDKYNGASASVEPGTAAPTVASAQAAEIPKLQASEPAFVLTSVSPVTLPAGSGVLIVYRRNSPAGPGHRALGAPGGAPLSHLRQPPGGGPGPLRCRRGGQCRPLRQDEPEPPLPMSEGSGHSPSSRSGVSTGSSSVVMTPKSPRSRTSRSASAPGEFVAVVGQSGSGKSTLLNLMAGLENPDGGSVWIRGHRISHRDRTEQAAWRGSSIGVLTQGSGLLDHLTVAANVDLAGFLRTRAQRSRRARTRGDRARYRQAAAHDRRAARGRRSALPARCSTIHPLGRRDGPGQLGRRSGGSARRVTGRRTDGRDQPGSRNMRVIELINELRPPGGATVIVTHSEAVARAAGRILELDGGVLQ